MSLSELFSLSPAQKDMINNIRTRNKIDLFIRYLLEKSLFKFTCIKQVKNSEKKISDFYKIRKLLLIFEKDRNSLFLINSFLIDIIKQKGMLENTRIKEDK